jgi:hypothetical protein
LPRTDVAMTQDITAERRCDDRLGKFCRVDDLDLVNVLFKPRRVRRFSGFDKRNARLCPSRTGQPGVKID